MTLTNVECVELLRAGAAAYRAGRESLTCPHPPRTEEALMWLRGWVGARRVSLIAG